jgi:hypothetical protein
LHSYDNEHQRGRNRSESYEHGEASRGIARPEPQRTDRNCKAGERFKSPHWSDKRDKCGEHNCAPGEQPKSK